MAVSFTVGEKFFSYDALESEIEQYQRANSVNCIRAVHGQLRLLKADVLKTFNDNLKVLEITFSCIHGEKNFRSEGTGKRNQR